MKFEFEVNLELEQETPIKDGQISVKVPKDQELRWKVLNVKNNKKLSDQIRSFALKLMDHVEGIEKAS